MLIDVTQSFDFSGAPITVTPDDDTDELIVFVEFEMQFVSFENLLAEGTFLDPVSGFSFLHGIVGDQDFIANVVNTGGGGSTTDLLTD